MRNVFLVIGLTSIVLLFLLAANIVNQSKQSVVDNNITPTQAPIASDDDAFVETVAASYRNPFESMITLEASPSANVAFPIVQLGNCANPQECYTYCLIPKNTPACWSFGTFVLNTQVLGASTSTVEGKKTFVSCNEDSSCRSYCQQNPDRCLGYSATEEDYLGPSGCTTEEECQSFCEDHPSLCPGFQSSQSISESPILTPTPTVPVR